MIEDLSIPKNQHHTAKRIYTRLQEEYPEQLQVKLRTVQYYVSKRKSAILQSQFRSYLPLSHPPGEAEVDFGEFLYKNETGTLFKAYKLTLSFPYSNMSYCQIFQSNNLQCLLQGMRNIFEHTARVPTKISFDNLSTVVVHIGPNHNRVLTEDFERFMLHYGFRAKFYNPHKPWEKGNVENKVGYERRNLFVPTPMISDFNSFNRQLFAACEKDAKRKHYIKFRFIEYLFTEDLEYMNTINTILYDIYTIAKRKTNNYGKLSFDGNTYSSSPNYIHETLIIKASYDTVSIINDKWEIITTHPRLYGKGKKSMNWFLYLKLMITKPFSINHTSFSQQLPLIWQQYLSIENTKEKQKRLICLYSILKSSNINTAEDALQIAKQHGTDDINSLISIFKTLINKSI